jgi:hypothetical protein
MDWITFVKKENVSKAEETLRNDFDLAAKQSITVRDAKTLGFNMDGSFFVISGGDAGVDRCKELIKGFVSEAKKEDLAKAQEAIRKEEEAAAEGMGGIFNI